MDPMPEKCRKRVRLYADNGVMITEITDVKSLEILIGHVRVVRETGLIVTLYGTITVEEVPSWRQENQL